MEFTISDVFFNATPLVTLGISDLIKGEKDFPALAFPVESLMVKEFKTLKQNLKTWLFIIKITKTTLWLLKTHEDIDIFDDNVSLGFSGIVKHIYIGALVYRPFNERKTQG